MQKTDNPLGTAHRLIFWRGIFFIFFGLMVFFWANIALGALILTFGIFALFDGGILIGMYVKHRHVWGRSSLWLGIFSVLVGLYAIFFPGLTAILLGLFVVLRTFLAGIFELRMSAHLKKHVAGESLLIASGMLSIFFAIILLVLLFTEPVFALIILVEMLGIYLTCFGILLLVFSSNLKKVGAKESKNITEVF